MEEKQLPAAKKVSWVKKAGYILLGALVIIQFFQPGKNNQSLDMANDISKVVTVPEDVHNILKTSCYDCHSNNTQYPWYANIQPLGWWLKDHIDEGKGHLNFQDFALVEPSERFPTKALRQDHKLEEVYETVEEGEMPLKSYTIIHGDAKLTDLQKKSILEWVKAARKELAERDSAAVTAFLSSH
ncbi:MAG: heme-binding domain-containing protein [Chitinophagaceae bacterium]|nr:heme-binding domain-containing protein [Chitinophagaceae bacterium]